MIEADLRGAVGRRVVVVGAANTDLVGIPDAPLVARDSNPGHVRVSCGGVGRNIAENLARLGASVELITAFGVDEAGRELVSACRLAGMGVDAALHVTDLPGARYLAITDENHDLALALSDVRVLDRLTAEALAEPARRAVLAEADLVVADTNLPGEAIAWLAREIEVPLLLDPVSAGKAPRAIDVLPRLAALKCNTLEASVLLGGHEVGSLAQVEYAAERLLLRGVGSVFLSAGEHGTHWADASGSGWVGAPRAVVANTTGAGDAFAAGVAFAMLADVGSERAARLGTALASIALEDEATVSERVTFDTALAAYREVRT